VCTSPQIRAGSRPGRNRVRCPFRRSEPRSCIRMEPFPRVELGQHPYKGRAGGRPEGHRVPGATRTHTAQPLMLVPPAVGLRGHGAAIRCRPGSPALRGQGRSRARRRSWPSWPRTRKLRGQGPADLPILLMAIRVRKAGLEPAGREFLSSRGIPDSRHFRTVRREGNEPPAVGLRARRSAAELAAHGADEENRTPVLSLEDCGSAIELHPHGGPRR
jgi:hypothetical protein